ncbi:MAG: superoxide dismutase [Planctomycetota bacterium]|nr:MAG: superoxide dismutase [Planctomycetota bacterium]
MKRYLIVTISAGLACVLLVMVGDTPKAWAHCQVPCGIYDDEARINGMLEDAVTIKKAMVQINELAAKSDALSLNQVTRWVNTKEQHASRIITMVSEYFLTQKVKEVAPGAEGYQKYLESLAKHHRVLRAAMKTKQTVDSVNAEKLHAAIKVLGELYD